MSLWIGTLGVIAGALLGWVLTTLGESWQRRRIGVVATRLIALELAAAHRDMKVALDEIVWWTADLATKELRTHLGELVFVTPLGQQKSLLKKVDDARELIETLNRKAHRARAASPARTPTSEDLTLISGAMPAIQVAKASLDPLPYPISIWPSVKGLWTSYRRYAIVSIFLIAIVGGDVLFVPRDDINAKTVAATLQSHFGPNVLADCNPASADWSCTVYRVPAPASDCLDLVPVAFSPHPMATPTGASKRCLVTAPATKVRVSDLGDKLVVSVPEDVYENNKIRKLIEDILEQAPVKTNIEKIADAAELRRLVDGLGYKLAHM